MFRFVIYLIILMMILNNLQSFTAHFLVALLASCLISKRAYDKKSLSLSGSLLALLVGFFTTLPNYGFFMCMLTFFVTSSYLTNLKAKKKQKIEESYKEGGQRTARQVACNGGVAVFISVVYLIEVGCGERPINFSKDFTTSVLITGLIGSLACCNGDTWSSELGTAYGGKYPRLITSWKTVPVGTNGGVTLLGLISSSLGGLAIGITFIASNYLFVFPNIGENTLPSQWPILLVTIYAGLVGSILDSLIGAVYQYSGYCILSKKVVSKPTPSTQHISGCDLLDNDQVNLISSILMALTTPIVAYYVWRVY
ncbi:transmembrane protein 19 isoform X2 [Hydra vulgaris]|uniref:Transmembrane protein 19 n=2 Tax=Hydra vulgaris TaxID=6087 RepID=T2M7V8_HYDVU